MTHKTALLPLLLFSAALAQTGDQTPQPTTPQAAPTSNWNSARLSTATYIILDPQMLGNPNLVGDSDRGSVLDAMRRDSAGALKRHYPGATISKDLGNAQAIRVTPIMVTPSSLLPWLKLTARLDFALPEGDRVTVAQDFDMWTVWQRQAEAANYVYDQLALRLP